MAIIHEAYLFKPSQFAEAVLPYVGALQKKAEGQQIMHNYVLTRFEQSSTIQALAMEYGGWDIGTLYDDANLPGPEKKQVLARWMLFLLYEYLFPVPSKFGLLGNWIVIRDILEVLNWHVSDRIMLIHGHSFGYFAQLWLANKAYAEPYVWSDLQYWEHIWPGSTASQVGWLDQFDVARLLSMLEMNETQLAITTLPNISTKVGIIENDVIQQTYQQGLQMLRAAIQARCGLCLITSG